MSNGVIGSSNVLTSKTSTWITIAPANSAYLTAVNKMMYYWYYKGIVNCTKSSSMGELYLKIEKYNSNKEAQYYNFYDNYHTYARLTVEVIDKGDKVQVDVMPF